jgi:hypothetical protein
MSFVSDYSFNNLARIGTDSACVDQRSIQNTGYCNYMTNNFFSKDSSMQTPIQMATSQPGIFYKGGNTVAAGGCNIDKNSELQIGSIHTAPGAKLDLYSRPYITIPFLGRGAVNVGMESQIKRGETLSSQRANANLSEKSYITYSQPPRKPELQNRVALATFTVEENSTHGWNRGGTATRELERDITSSNNF